MHNIIEKIANLFGKTTTPSFIALSVFEFTDESWLEQIRRQGRFNDYLDYSNHDYNENNWYTFFIHNYFDRIRPDAFESCQIEKD